MFSMCYAFSDLKFAASRHAKPRFGIAIERNHFADLLAEEADSATRNATAPNNFGMGQTRDDEEADVFPLGITDAALALALDGFGKGGCISLRRIERRALEVLADFGHHALNGGDSLSAIPVHTAHRSKWWRLHPGAGVRGTWLSAWRAASLRRWDGRGGAIFQDRRRMRTSGASEAGGDWNNKRSIAIAVVHIEYPSASGRRPIVFRFSFVRVRAASAA